MTWVERVSCFLFRRIRLTSFFSSFLFTWVKCVESAAQKMKFSIKDFFCKCGQFYWRKRNPNGKLHFLCSESRLTCRSSNITKYSHKYSSSLRFETTFHSGWSLFPQQVTYIEKKILKKVIRFSPLPTLPIQHSNLFSGKLLHPFRYHLHFPIIKGNNSLHPAQLQREDQQFLFVIFSISSFNFWST